MTKQDARNLEVNIFLPKEGHNNCWFKMLSAAGKRNTWRYTKDFKHQRMHKEFFRQL
jgi:hypothetical protein